MEMQLESHSFTKVLLCRKRCNHCEKVIRVFGLRCRLCRIKYHKGCSLTAPQSCRPCYRHRKSKTTFLRRNFGANRKGRNETHSANHDLHTTPCVPGLRLKFGPLYHVNNTQEYSHFNGKGDSEIGSPVKLTNYDKVSPVSTGDISGSCGRLNQSYFVTSPTRSRNPSTQALGLHPPSALSLGYSSGYSSVNQSSESSAGTGSQPSRSSTPDKFEGQRETTSVDGFTFGERCPSRTNIAGSREELVVCGVGCDRRRSNSPVAESPFPQVDNDDEISADWNERERLESLEPGLKKSLKELEIPYSDLEIDSKVGVGPSGPVYRGRWHGDVMVHTRIASQREEVEEFRKEVLLLSMIRHENVMLFMGACLEPPNLAVVVSLRKCLSIHNHLHCQDSRWSIATRLNIMLQVAQGMSYLHAKSITVPFLRTMNIFLESKVKLCINEYTCLHHQVKRQGYGSVPQGHLTYLAPEVISKVHVHLSSGRVLDNTVRTKKMDVYAYGTVMYEILTDKWPFSNLSPETVIWMIGKGLPHSLTKVRGPDSVKDLIKSCWSHDPNQRPEFTHITQILKQRNISTNCISRRHSISEPENMQYVGKITDYCQLKRI